MDVNISAGGLIIRPAVSLAIKLSVLRYSPLRAYIGASMAGKRPTIPIREIPDLAFTYLVCLQHRCHPEARRCSRFSGRRKIAGKVKTIRLLSRTISPRL